MAAFLTAIAWPAAGSAPLAWDAQPLVAQLAADLASHASATQVLQSWCADRHLADPPLIVAQRQFGRDKPVTPEIRKLLQAGADEPIRYRRVALACGRRVLSRADNWYRPGKLTDAMNTELDGTDHPFGAVVKPLGFHRESLEAQVLMKPDAAKVPGEIIRNKALLETADGTPFSLVVETYSKVVLSQGSDHAPRIRSVSHVRRPRLSAEVVSVVREPRPRHRSDRLRTERPKSDHIKSSRIKSSRIKSDRSREDRVSRRR